MNTEAKHEPTIILPADYRGGLIYIECTTCHRNVKVTSGTIRGHVATSAAIIKARQA